MRELIDGEDREELVFVDPPQESAPRRRSDDPSDWRILIVDDEEDVHRITRLALAGLQFQGRRIFCLSAYSAAEAVGILAKVSDIAIVLLDVVMEGPDSGLALVRHIRDTLGNKTIRIILRTGQPGQAPEGRVIIDYDINDYKAKTELTEQKLFTSVIASLRTYGDLIALEKLNQELENSQKEIIFTLGELVDMRSTETGGHVRRVGEYSRLLASKFGRPEDEAQVIGIASAMHDVGKLSIPDAILRKTGRLSRREFETMKTHAAIGASLLRHSERAILRMAAIIAAQHHERYDGSGYPLGLSGESIELPARIAAIADVFDAISHDRIYRKAMTKSELIHYFRIEVADQFDPALLRVFLDNFDEFYQLKDE